MLAGSAQYYEQRQVSGLPDLTQQFEPCMTLDTTAPLQLLQIAMCPMMQSCNVTVTLIYNLGEVHQ